MRNLLKNRTVIFSALVLVVLLSGYAFLHGGKSASLANTDTEVTLTDYEGKSVRFEQFVSGFNHKPLVVYFWATWCPYCKAEFADLSSLKEQMGDRVQVVAVNRGESSSEAKAFTDSLSLPAGLIYLLDSGDTLFKKLGGYAMPETLFINAKGEKILQQHGPISKEDLTATAAKLLP